MTQEIHEIIVLDDGETFTMADSARIVRVTSECLERIGNDEKIKNLSKEDGVVSVHKIPEVDESVSSWDSWWDSMI